MAASVRPILRLVGNHPVDTPPPLPAGVRALHVECPDLLAVVADAATGGFAAKFRVSSIWSDAQQAPPSGYLLDDPHRRILEAGDPQVQRPCMECPACRAVSWQGSPRYPGVDTWANRLVDSGTVLMALGPRTSGFFTTLSALAAAEHDLSVLCEGLQVAQCAQGRAHPRISLYQLVQDRVVAAGFALANTHYGAGGLPQVYMPIEIPA